MILGALVFLRVDLAPKVEDDFFFSSDDPQLQETLRIEEIFRGTPQVFVAVDAPSLFTRQTVSRVFALSEELSKLPGVAKVTSLTHGPMKREEILEEDMEDLREKVLESPLWTRVLLSPDRKVSFVMLGLKPEKLAEDSDARKGDDPEKGDAAEKDGDAQKNGDGREGREARKDGDGREGRESRTEGDVRKEDSPHGATVRAIDEVLTRHERDDFRLAASGVPYVAEHIRAQLSRDLTVFTLAALVVFTVLLLLLFRSWIAVLGMITAALTTCFVTFLIRALFGMTTGVLTPNLWTIAFVLTLSHVVYLTASYQRTAREKGKQQALRESIRLTGPASAWSLVANLLGFASLVFVDAKPLREFGASGAIAAVAALATAYVIYPPFLDAVRSDDRSGALSRLGERVFTRRRPWVAAGFIIAALALAPWSRKVDTDPSLPSYLAENSKVRVGIEKIDESGGSSPLELVVRDSGGGTLADGESYKRLKALQLEIERHPDVGNVLSLALLMEETKRPWYSFLFPWKKKMDEVEKPKHGGIGRSFWNEDRTLGRYFLRMHEQTRTRPRAEIIVEIQDLVRKHGFEPVMTGGAYRLQGALSELVKSSVTRGLGGLLALFCVIMLCVSRSLRSALAMTFCLALVPFALYGLVALTGMRLDIISAPAANVALPMGIDEMIHLTYSVRRARKRQEGQQDRKAWTEALSELWKPTVISMIVVASGFSLFLLSKFPPTHRLGALICGGAVLTDLAVLLVLPVLATLGWKASRSRRSVSESSGPVLEGG